MKALSCSLLLLTGNLLKTIILREFNLVLSRYFLSWLPSVLHSTSSSFLKKCGRSFKAHKCHSVSGFDRACWMVLTLVGVTHVPINFSLTAWAVPACWVTWPSVGWLSSRSPFTLWWWLGGGSDLMVHCCHLLEYHHHTWKWLWH